MYDTKKLSFLSGQHEAPEVDDGTCGNEMTTYHEFHLTMETNFVYHYKTDELLACGRNRIMD